MQDSHIYINMTNSALKEKLADYKNLSLNEVKEILHILSETEMYRIESNPSLLSKIISHFELSRSGELKYTNEETNLYNLEKTKISTVEENRAEVEFDKAKEIIINKKIMSEAINKLKIKHAGKILSNAGRYLLVAQVVMFLVIFLNILILSYGDKYLETEFFSEFRENFILIDGLIFCVVFIFQFKGYSSIQNAGVVLESDES